MSFELITVSQFNAAPPWQDSFVESNSVNNTKFIAYFIPHKYCDQRIHTGIWAVLIKKPANNSCGTNSNGANSVTSLTLGTAAPSTSAAELDARPRQSSGNSYE